MLAPLKEKLLFTANTEGAVQSGVAGNHGGPPAIAEIEGPLFARILS
jgi:hypothetical protein